MRKIFVLFLLLSFSLSLFSQKNITFKGVELSCDVNDVTAKLKTLGFSPVIENEEVYRYEGQYAGRTCSVVLREFESDLGSCELVVGFDFLGDSYSLQEVRMIYDFLMLDLKKDFGEGHYVENYYSLSGECEYATVYDIKEGFSNGKIALTFFEIGEDKYIELIYTIYK